MQNILSVSPKPYDSLHIELGDFQSYCKAFSRSSQC